MHSVPRHVTPEGDKEETKTASNKGQVGAEIDGLLEVLSLADQAQGRRHESVPGVRELWDEAVLPIRRLGRGGHDKGRWNARPLGDSSACRDWDRGERVERRGSFATEEPVHDAQRSDASPVSQRLQLDAFRVAHDADGPDLDPVQAREGSGWSPQPQGTAVFEL